MERQRRISLAGSGVRRHGPVSSVAACLLMGLVVALVAASPALGAFTRPFITQIAGVPVSPEEPHVAPFETEVPFGGATGSVEGPDSVAVDAEGDLWVGNGLSGATLHELDEFGPEGHFLNAIKLESSQASPTSIAVSDGNGDVYVAGRVAGGTEEYRVEVFEPDGKAVANTFPAFAVRIHLAVDNSPGPTEGTVYVALEGNSLEGKRGDVKKFSPLGEPADFTEIKKPEIVGGEFSEVAVDGEGNVYGINLDPLNEVNSSEIVIDEFRAGGVLRDVIDESAAAHWGEGEPDGISFDPVSKHVLVAVSRLVANEGFVDEFDSTGTLVSEVRQVPDPSALATSCGVPRAGPLHSATAVAAAAAGEVYVVDETSERPSPGTCEHAVDVYGLAEFLPAVTIAEASERTQTSAVLNGSVNPEKRELTECDFEYVTEAAYRENVKLHGGDGFADLKSGGKLACVPEAGAITGDTAVAVHADVSKASEGTTYRYRLLATSGGERGGTSESQSLAFTTPARPVVVSTSASAVSSEDVDLGGEIDPVGASTSYYFEYVDEAHYHAGAEDPYAEGGRLPAVAVDVGSGGPTGSADAKVRQQLAGLAPGTVYLFRLVASNEIGVTDGPDHSFTTLEAPAAGLPDHRVYELVTPSDKGGAGDLFSSSTRYVNPDGGFPAASGEAYLMPNTLVGFGPSPASEANSYVFKREVAGWRTIPVVPSLLGVQSVVTTAFEPQEFARVALLDIVGSSSSASGAARVSFVGPPGGPYATLHADASVHEEPEDHEETEVVGASHGLDHVVLESLNHDLGPGAELQDAGSHALFEWTGGGECEADSSACKLVNVDSHGQLVARCGAVLGQGKTEGLRSHAVSADGSEVIFTAPDPYAIGHGAGCWNGGPEAHALHPEHAPQLYLRSGGQTTELSVPEAGVTEEGAAPTQYPAVYVGASEDGSRVFFTTRTELTKQAAALKLHDPELYECEITESPGGPECKLTRISAGESGAAAGSVVAAPAVADDGAAVYFTSASGELAPGASAPASEAEVDLYRYDVESGQTAYVATVDRSDYPQDSAAKWGSEFPEVALAQEANWYTTPDGDYLLFASARELTGYSTAEAPGAFCPLEAASGGSGLVGHCAEVYRYDALDGSVVCVSCNPSGAAPVSNAQFARRTSAGGVPAGGSDNPLSEDGSYAFFDTADALVPQDTDGTLDVYEWHEEGERARVSLISSGEDLAPSYFLGASATGANVFFGTHARLVPEDTDSSGDVYDARIDGGFAAASAGEVECEGAACQGPSAPPTYTTPSSSTFSGPGDVASNAGPAAGKPAPKPTAAQLRAKALARALKACRARHNEKRRRSCEASARKRFGKKQAKRSSIAIRKGGR
jgi:hypothetical protein